MDTNHCMNKPLTNKNTMKKRTIIFWALIIAVCGCSMAQTQTPVYNPLKVYDTVTEADSCYLFFTPKPCIDREPGYEFMPAFVFVQEYMTSDTVTVYGVAVTVKNQRTQVPIYNNCSTIRALMTIKLGINPNNSNYYRMQQVDTVTLFRSHPRFCWFKYEDDCKQQSWTEPCYELYFDTPAQINTMTDTFYVGLEYLGYDDILPTYPAGRYSNSLPGHIYGAISTGENSLGWPSGYDCFSYHNSAAKKLWGVAFPIIGFHCKPVTQYWIIPYTYTGNSIALSWPSNDDGTVYNLRLVGEDGSDSTIVTTDTTVLVTQLSDSVRYNVMLRKQCNYATSNYDTTVYSEWLSYISFGTTILPDTTTIDTTAVDTTVVDTTVVDTTVVDTVGIMHPMGEDFMLRPNPARGAVQIVLPAEALGGMVVLCDLEGRELIVRKAMTTTMDLDVSKLPQGVYLVKLLTSRGTHARRLLVERP